MTLWYRSPELILGSHHYGPEVDIWSVGCLFGEMKSRALQRHSGGNNNNCLFPGREEMHQLELIYQLCGTPSGEVEEEYKKFKLYDKMNIAQTYRNKIQKKYHDFGATSLSLLESMLDMHPMKRITAEKALMSDYFWTDICPEPEILPRFQVEAAFSLSGTYIIIVYCYSIFSSLIIF